MSDDPTTGTTPSPAPMPSASTDPAPAAAPVPASQPPRAATAPPVTDTAPGDRTGSGGGASSEGAGPTSNGGAPSTGETGGLDENGAPRKRRRRGSRGGRNRKRPGDGSGGSVAESDDDGDDGDDRDDRDAGERLEGTGAVRAPSAGRPAPGTHSPRPAGDPGRRPGSRNEDYSDPKADRGLTTDDVAESAAEDAGLRTPRIGDTRPAPAAPPAARSAGNGGGNGNGNGNGGRPRGGGPGGADTGTTEMNDDGTPRTPRRRRRGGRGRSKTRTGEPRPTTTVEADLGLGEGVELSELDDAALQRRRGQTRKGRAVGRYLMGVHVAAGTATQIAVLEGRALVEHSVSRPEDDDTSIDGNIYLGRVQNVLPGMEAAFIDIGTPKNGVLYRGDVAFDESEVEEKEPKIERLLKNGQMILVQVTKNPIGHKGARLTQEVSLAGRFVVMVPGQPKTYGISKRLPDDERKRLRRVLDGIKPEDAGLIVRTAAEGATPDELTRDMQRLRSQWEQISALAAKANRATLLYKEPPLVVRRIREEFTKEYRGVSIDDKGLYEEIKAYVEAIAPELAERIEYYDEDAEGLPLFERFHIHEQLVKALDRKVWLPSGGSLVIERTEALTVIDVNTGKNVGKSNLEETVFTNNLEAADEVARQLRLRDIGGIIVIDFIDMEIKKNRDAVLRGFKDALARDKTRTQVFEISELGLVEMTRKRISEGLVEAFSETCEVCHGRGFTVDESLLG
jgi:ribonuclease E